MRGMAEGFLIFAEASNESSSALEDFTGEILMLNTLPYYRSGSLEATTQIPMHWPPVIMVSIKHGRRR